jgi:hypothetical protein
MNEDYQWERHNGGSAECWHLRHYHLGAGEVVGSIRKQKNKRRCSRWIVALCNGWDSRHICVLDDMKRFEALTAAKLILLSLKESA